jgi:hypothetical protein
MPCQNAWCGKCYIPVDKGRFITAKPMDEDNLVVEKEGDIYRFVMGRDKDHLMCPFQCNDCHFLNMMARRPIEDKAEDIKLMGAIRRANLDAFWSRESLTVSKNF